MSRTKRKHPFYYNLINWTCAKHKVQWIPKDLYDYGSTVWGPKGKKWLKRLTSKKRRRQPVEE